MIKQIDDYLDFLVKKYPYVPKEQLIRILKWGFYKFHWLTKRGADIHVSNGTYKAYCGWRFYNDNARAQYLMNKKRGRLRMNYVHDEREFEGKYYFGVDDEQFEKISKNPWWGKVFHKVTFENIKLYKIKEEAFLKRDYTHFFILYYPVDVGFTFTEKKLTTLRYEYFAKRDENGNIILI